MAQNWAAKYSNKVDERFTRESQALMGTNKDYDWSGVKTVKVYQVDTVPLGDYERSGAGRYGTPTDLGTSIQEMTLTQDKAFTFVIDKGDKNESMMVTDAGKALAREQREVLVPFVDSYIFNKQAQAAVENGQVDTVAASSSTAYAKFLKANEVQGNKNVPDAGKIAYCSYSFANLLMQDPAFIKYGDRSQEMVIKGVLGEVDGLKIVKVPASRLPHGTSFMIVHPMATVAPETLKEFKTHQDPPGLSGWLVEGRFIFDAFVLDAKKDCIYLGLCEGILGEISASKDDANKLVIDNANRFVGTLKKKAGSATVAYGDADTGFTAAAIGETVSATTTYVYSVDGKIIASGVVTA